MTLIIIIRHSNTIFLKYCYHDKITACSLYLIKKKKNVNQSNVSGFMRISTYYLFEKYIYDYGESFNEFLKSDVYNFVTTVVNSLIHNISF